MSSSAPIYSSQTPLTPARVNSPVPHPVAVATMFAGWVFGTLALAQSAPLPVSHVFFDLSGAGAASEARLGQRVQFNVSGRQGLSLCKGVWRLAPGNTTDCFQARTDANSVVSLAANLLYGFLFEEGRIPKPYEISLNLELIDLASP